MKLIIFAILIFLNSILPTNKIVYAETSFAQAKKSTHLYKNTNFLDESILCIVEETYFVEILAEADNLYKVNYNNVTGFVKKNDVLEVLNIPNTPYPYNIQLEIGSDCNLRSSPTTKSKVNNILTTIYKGETNISFIGRIYADEAIDFCGTTWYYVNYNGYTGYIYNKYVKSITPIYKNTENVTFIKNEEIKLTNPIVHTPSLILILIMLIPCILIILILYLPRKFKIKNRRQSKPQKSLDRY